MKQIKLSQEREKACGSKCKELIETARKENLNLFEVTEEISELEGFSVFEKCKMAGYFAVIMWGNI